MLAYAQDILKEAATQLLNRRNGLVFGAWDLQPAASSLHNLDLRREEERDTDYPESNQCEDIN